MSEHSTLVRLVKALILLSGAPGYTKADLIEKLGVSERTIFRYIKLFRNAGMCVDIKDGFYRIPLINKSFKELSDLLHFTEEEGYLITNAIQSLTDDSLLKSNLIRKLCTIYDNPLVPETVIKSGYSNNVHLLSNAIKGEKCVLLKQYRSSNGRLIRDRLVEPFEFTLNYNGVWTYEPESRQNKVFKVSRIESVQILPDKNWKFKSEHQKQPLDIFRISGEKEFHVKINLTLRAYNLLIEEFPLSEPYIKQIDDNTWQFDGLVRSKEGVLRFCMGLCDQVRILDNKELQNAMIEKAKKYIY